MSKHTITCEATATIRERWAFDLPEGWGTMPEDERQDAIGDAATGGDCLGDEVLGDEENREWDLSSIEPLSEPTNAASSVEQRAVQACSNLQSYLRSGQTEGIETCPECASKDIYEVSTGIHAYRCNGCGDRFDDPAVGADEVRNVVRTELEKAGYLI